MLITIAGMIGGGKSSLTNLISKEFGGNAYYEQADSPILQKFYTASQEELVSKRYPFLLQLEFLNSRFKMIKHCLIEGKNPKVNVLDRSIYEDKYFTLVNHRLGRISDEEMVIYNNLVDNMLEELEELPKKAPDLLIYLKGSFETFKNRIENRGRSFEALDEETEAYFYELWKGYDEWVSTCYKASPVLVIDIDYLDYVNSKEDAKKVVEIVRLKLKELNLLENEQPKGTLKVSGNISFTSIEELPEEVTVHPEEVAKENLLELFKSEILGGKENTEVKVNKFEMVLK